MYLRPEALYAANRASASSRDPNTAGTAEATCLPAFRAATASRATVLGGLLFRRDCGIMGSEVDDYATYFPIYCYLLVGVIAIVEKEGELNTIDLVVNSLARIANHCTDLAGLERLFYVMGEILDAIPPLSPEALLNQSALHPCQLLLLNRAIVATRTLTPRLMEIAYTDVSELLPEEAQRFFSEGMEQIEIQNYPEAVREVIESYYRKRLPSKTLH